MDQPDGPASIILEAMSQGISIQPEMPSVKAQLDFLKTHVPKLQKREKLAVGDACMIKESIRHRYRCGDGPMILLEMLDEPFDARSLIESIEDMGSASATDHYDCKVAFAAMGQSGMAMIIMYMDSLSLEALDIGELKLFAEKPKDGNVQ